MSTLITEISRCPHVQHCVENPSSNNLCAEIVSFQNSTLLSSHQVPEPWSGHLEQAPILFLSSNPSISSNEVYPLWSWSDSDMNDFFNNRFGGGRKDWVKDGTKSLELNGTYSGSVMFWSKSYFSGSQYLELIMQSVKLYIVNLLMK